MPKLIELLSDSCVVVRDTTAWTIGRVCDIIPTAVINEYYLEPLLTALVAGLSSEPRVASNVCWVCNNCSSCNMFGIILYRNDKGTFGYNFHMVFCFGSFSSVIFIQSIYVLSELKISLAHA